MSRPLKVLVVDDDPTVLAITQALLEDLGHNVIARDTALGTTNVILKEKPDVVLLDVEMPALSGDRIMSLVKDRPGFEKVKFILYSGKHKATIHQLARDTGAVGGIVKTGDHELFAREFQRLVGSAS